MRPLRPLLVLLVVSGCGSVEPVAGEVAKRKNVGPNRGFPGDSSRLGNPTTKEPGSGGTTYVWTNEVTVAGAPVMTTQTSYASGRPQTSETTAISTLPQRRSCTLRAMADNEGVILSAMAMIAMISMLSDGR